MTQDVENRQTPIAVARTAQIFAQRAVAMQAEFAESVIQANRHWLQQAAVEWNEALELFRKLNANETTAEKVSALQAWLRDATERAMKDATYAIEVNRELGNIELKLFGSPAQLEEPKAPKAA